MSEPPHHPEEQETDPMSFADYRIQEARKIHPDYLDLSGLGLTGLPESFAQLSKLKSLYLDRNQLTLLPESITQLSRLQVLSLRDNRLTALPESVARLSQ